MFLIQENLFSPEHVQFLLTETEMHCETMEIFKILESTSMHLFNKLPIIPNLRFYLALHSESNR